MIIKSLAVDAAIRNYFADGNFGKRLFSIKPLSETASARFVFKVVTSCFIVSSVFYLLYTCPVKYSTVNKKHLPVKYYRFDRFLPKCSLFGRFISADFSTILIAEIKERSGNMGEKNYRICLTAPLGARSGNLVFHET